MGKQDKLNVNKLQLIPNCGKYDQIREYDAKYSKYGYTRAIVVIPKYM